MTLYLHSPTPGVSDSMNSSPCLQGPWGRRTMMRSDYTLHYYLSIRRVAAPTLSLQKVAGL